MATADRILAFIAAYDRVHGPDGSGNGRGLDRGERASRNDSGVASYAGLRCENDVGGRFTLWPSGDSHGAFRLSAGSVASCASASRLASAARAARTVTVATPQAEGLVRARGPACFHTLPPPSRGRSRSNDPSREGHQAPVAAVPCGDQPSAHRQGDSGGGAPRPPAAGRQRRGKLGDRRGGFATPSIPRDGASEGQQK